MAEVNPQDLEVANQGPAIYANRVIVNLGPVVRLSFVEQVAEDKPPIGRVSVALPH
jgi:hypothetical protein